MGAASGRAQRHPQVWGCGDLGTWGLSPWTPQGQWWKMRLRGGRERGVTAMEGGGLGGFGASRERVEVPVTRG